MKRPATCAALTHHSLVASIGLGIRAGAHMGEIELKAKVRSPESPFSLLRVWRAWQRR